VVIPSRIEVSDRTSQRGVRRASANERTCFQAVDALPASPQGESTMVTVRDAWRKLAIRIEGLEASITSFIRLSEYLLEKGARRSFQNEDKFSIQDNVIHPAISACLDDIRIFRDYYKPMLPIEATESLDRFAKCVSEYDRDTRREAQMYRIHIVSALIAIRSEISYALEGSDLAGRRLVERALSHLCRRIVVDEDYRAKWQKAYDKGETECEKFGAIHLLSHGIWAFKAHTSEERTDLVLGTPLESSDVEKSADALVLTEWKKIAKASPKGSIDATISHAINQAKIYAKSILAGYEIYSARYIPIVSWDRLEVHDQRESDIIYRVVNIPVNPSPPHTSRATA